MAKGRSFEWEISKILSAWITDSTRDDIFMPTVSSGAMYTSRKKSGKDTKNQGGDITSNDILGDNFIEKFNIELKTGYSKKSKRKDGIIVQSNWCILDILDSKEKIPLFISFWEQCRKSAEETNRIPLLIFRRQNRIPLIAMTYKFYEKESGLIFLSDQLPLIVGNIVIVTLSRFLEHYTFKKN